MLCKQCHVLMRNLLYAQRIKNVGITQDLNTSAVHWQLDYYGALGVAPSSTQSEIKAAYYKLSMQYHPDKNKGSAGSATKFREITQAYEVLGNYRLRRLYDKGIIHTSESKFTEHGETSYEPEVEDDPETRFYKSRFKRSQVSDTMGRTPIYDFDEWSRAHYGKSFQRRQTAKERFDTKEAQKRHHSFSIQNEYLLFGMVVGVIVVYAVFHAESSLDTPQQRNIEEANSYSENTDSQ